MPKAIIGNLPTTITSNSTKDSGSNKRIPNHVNQIGYGTNQKHN